MRSPSRHRRGFTLIEVTVACAMTVSLSVLLFATWAVLMRSTANLIAWEQLFQEMDLAVTAISRDVGGGLLDDRTGTKQQGCLLGCRATNEMGAGDHLQLFFGGSGTGTGQPNWSSPGTDDVIIDYYVDAESNTLVRKNLRANTQFAVARNVGGTKADGTQLAGITVEDDPTNTGNLKVTLTFLYVLNPGATVNPNLDRSLVRPCTLIVKKSP
jgi:hypothetical protein